MVIACTALFTYAYLVFPSVYIDLSVRVLPDITFSFFTLRLALFLPTFSHAIKILSLSERIRWLYFSSGYSTTGHRVTPWGLYCTMKQPVALGFPPVARMIQLMWSIL